MNDRHRLSEILPHLMLRIGREIDGLVIYIWRLHQKVQIQGFIFGIHFFYFIIYRRNIIIY